MGRRVERGEVVLGLQPRAAGGRMGVGMGARAGGRRRGVCGFLRNVQGGVRAGEEF